MFDFLKPYACPICGASYWLPKPAYDCCKGTPAYGAWRRQIDQRVAAAKAAKRGGYRSNTTIPPRAGLDLKDCPICHGATGNWNCRLCDGSGKVPDNVL